MLWILKNVVDIGKKKIPFKQIQFHQKKIWLTYIFQENILVFREMPLRNRIGYDKNWLPCNNNIKTAITGSNITLIFDLPSLYFFL